MKKFIFLMTLICCASFITWGQAPPTCGALLAPADMATGVSVNPTITFTIPDSATGFTWVEGISAGMLTDTIVSQAATGGDTLTFFRNNLTTSQTVFWSIIPYNANGDAGSGCNVYRYTTQDAPQATSGASCSSGSFGAFFYEPFGATTPTGWYGDIGNGTSEMWDVIQVGLPGSPSTGPSGPHAGTNYAYFESSVNGSRNDSAALFTPPIDLSGSTDNVELEFFIHAYGANMGALNVSATTDTTGGGTWTSIVTLSQSYQGNSTAAWLPVRYNLGTAYNGGNLHLRFTANKLAPSDFQSDFGIDEITIKTCQACPNPSSGMASNHTSVGAQLSWTDNASAGLFELAIDTAGFHPDSVTPITTSSNPYTWSGGMATTDYEFYVRSLCDEGATPSGWAGPYAFTTLCGPITPDHVENFSTWLPACWVNISDPAGSGGSWEQDDWLNDTGHPNGKAAKINIYFTEIDTLISPDFDLTGGPFQVDYNIALMEWNSGTASTFGSDDNCQFMISTNAGASWTVLKTYAAGTEPSLGQFEQFDLTAYAGMTVRFAFVALGGAVNDAEDNDLMVDNFMVRTPPACSDPSAGSAANVTSTSADLSWTDNAGSSTQFIIEIDTAGFTPDGMGAVTSATATYMFTTGAPNTAYDFYITTVCGSDSSAVVGPFSFQTLCATEIAEYCQGFELFPDGNLDGATFDCWQNVRSAEPEWKGEATTTTSGSTGPSGPHTGSRYIYLETSTGSAGATDTITGPVVDISGLTNPGLSFWYHMYGSTMGTLHYEVSTDGGAWTSLGSIVGQQQSATTDPWLEKIVALSGNTVRLRFVGETGGIFTSDMAVDDVCFKELPSCYAPAYTVTPDPSNCPVVDILIDITALGSAATYNMTNNVNASMASGGVGMYTLTGFAPDDVVEVYIADASDPMCADTITLNLLGTCPAPNDECVTALPLMASTDFNCNNKVSGTTVNANPSTTADSTCSTSGKDVWYNFTTSTAGDYFFRVTETMDFGSSSTYVTVYSGACGALTQVGTSCTTTSVGLTLAASTTYRVNVRSTSTTAGVNFDLCAYKLPPAPANDLCSGAIALMESDLTCNMKASGTTVSATASTVADSSCSTTNKDVWYTFSPASTADYIFSVVETMDFGASSTYVSVFSGTCGALTQINSSCFSTTTTVALTASTTYYVNVRSTSATAGVNFDLCAYTCVAALTPDYAHPFNTFPGGCWSQQNAGTIGGSWVADDWRNVVGGPNGRCAKINMYSLENDTMYSPPIDLTAGGPYRVKYNVALTDWNGTTGGTFAADDQVQLLISDDDGATWTSLMTYNAAMEPSADGQTDSLDLNAYSGSTVRFAFWASGGAVDDAEDNDFFVDNFQVYAYAGGPCGPVTVNGIATGTYQGTTISSDATVPSPNMVLFKASNSIDLLPNFNVAFGATFDAQIAPCP